MMLNGLIFELETMERVELENGEVDYITDSKHFLVFKSTSYDKVNNLVKALIKQTMRDGSKDSFIVYLYGLDRQYKKVEYIKFVSKKSEMRYERMEFNKERGLYERVERGYIDNIDREILNTIEYIKENVLI